MMMMEHDDNDHNEHRRDQDSRLFSCIRATEHDNTFFKIASASSFTTSSSPSASSPAVCKGGPTGGPLTRRLSSGPPYRRQALMDTVKMKDKYENKDECTYEPADAKSDADEYKDEDGD